MINWDDIIENYESKMTRKLFKDTSINMIAVVHVLKKVLDPQKYAVYVGMFTLHIHQPSDLTRVVEVRWEEATGYEVSSREDSQLRIKSNVTLEEIVQEVKTFLDT